MMVFGESPQDPPGAKGIHDKTLSFNRSLEMQVDFLRFSKLGFAEQSRDW